MKLLLLTQELSICSLASGAEIPAWSTAGEFFCVMRAPGELSVVCESRGVPASVKQDAGWRALRVDGVLDFSLTGILASIANPLAKAKVSIFALSTFNTDYVLVKCEQLETARSALAGAGFQIS